MTTDELMARLRAMFVEELDDQVREANGHLLALERAPGDPEELRSLFRVVHTLKGAARAANVLELERLCHRLEGLLASARDAGRHLTADEMATLFAGVDRLATAAADLRGGAAPAPQPDPAKPAVAARAAEPVVDRRDAPLARDRESAVRVARERIDALLGMSNRLLVLSARMSDHPGRVEHMHDAAAHATRIWHRLRRELGADAHGLEQALTALGDALADIRGESTTLLGESLRDTRELGRAAADVSLGVRELRMRPFADAVSDLPRVVRDVAAATQKRARLEIEGQEVQADRAVLAQLHDALRHLVRNAVDHGIELPDERRARGKPEEGLVRVSASLVGDRLVVTVRDDGAGLNLGAMRRRLAERGEEAPADDRALARRLFQGGVSTQETATAISGRGVGLDAVRSVAERVRGAVDVTWQAGRGTAFILDAPLTLATVRVVLARVGKLTAALPTAFIARMLRLQPDAVRLVEGHPAVETDGAPAPIASLAAVLGPPLADRPAERALQLVLVQAGERRVALRVDELLDEVEVVVRPIRAQGRAVARHVSGAAMMPDGAIALVLNLTAVAASALGLPADTGFLSSAPAEAPVRKRILVVDDSITTRTLETSVLEAAGYDVVAAVDGADGWRLLQERGADLVVSDVEMPRMDGFQLCEAIRASARFRELPVILVTALETPEHRARGLEAGADAYLAKSSFDQESLLSTIHDFLGA